MTVDRSSITILAQGNRQAMYDKQSYTHSFEGS